MLASDFEWKIMKLRNSHQTSHQVEGQWLFPFRCSQLNLTLSAIDMPSGHDLKIVLTMAIGPLKAPMIKAEFLHDLKVPPGSWFFIAWSRAPFKSKWPKHLELAKTLQNCQVDRIHWTAIICLSWFQANVASIASIVSIPSIWCMS